MQKYKKGSRIQNPTALIVIPKTNPYAPPLACVTVTMEL